MATAIVAAPGGLSNVGFAVPVDLLERTVASLIDPSDKNVSDGRQGGAEPNEIGIMAEDARPGVRVIRVLPGSRGAALGAKPGDLITHADDRPVSSVAALAAHLKSRGPDGIRLTFQRGTDSRTVEVLLTSASF